MRLVLGIAAVVTMALAFAAMGVSVVGSISAHGNSLEPEGGAGGLLLMALSGALLKWRERY